MREERLRGGRPRGGSRRPTENLEGRCVPPQNRSAPGGNARPAWQDLHRSIVQRPYPPADNRGSTISGPFGRFRKRAVFEGLLRLPGAPEPAARRLCSGRLEKQHVACPAPAPEFLPNRADRLSPESTHTY